MEAMSSGKGKRLSRQSELCEIERYEMNLLEITEMV